MIISFYAIGLFITPAADALLCSPWHVQISFLPLGLYLIALFGLHLYKK
jgi:hypothetical protein